MADSATYIARQIRLVDDKEARGQITLEEAARLHYEWCRKARRLGVYEDMRRQLVKVNALAV